MVNRGFTVAVEPPHSVRSEAAVRFSCGREVGGRGGRKREGKKKEGEKRRKRRKGGRERRGRLSSSRERESVDRMEEKKNPGKRKVQWQKTYKQD